MIIIIIYDVVVEFEYRIMMYELCGFMKYLCKMTIDKNDKIL